MMDEPAFIRYLASKKTVDDRALNQRVWRAMTALLEGGRPNVLELGAGTGTMVERAVSGAGGIQPRAWTLVDSQAGLLAEARRRLEGRVPFELRYVTADAQEYISTTEDRFGLVAAHAFIDLFDLESLVPGIVRLAEAGGCALFTVCFDGLSAWEPQVDRELDARIVELYHRTMDERVTAGRPSGDSRSGRHLLTLLPRLGHRVVEAGASDWVVYPRDGAYPADERFFLSCILGFFQESLCGRPELERAELDRWLSARRAQLEAGELVFIAHQLDVLAAAGP